MRLDGSGCCVDDVVALEEEVERLEGVDVEARVAGVEEDFWKWRS